MVRVARHFVVSDHKYSAIGVDSPRKNKRIILAWGLLHCVEAKMWLRTGKQYPMHKQPSPYRFFRPRKAASMALAVAALAVLCACPWPSGDLEGTWTNELDGGQLSFRGDTIDWYGDRGSFTTGQREWFVDYRYDAGWIDAQLSESR